VNNAELGGRNHFVLSNVVISKW